MRPVFRFLSDGLVHEIRDEALRVLEKVGVLVDHEEARALLLDAGCRQNTQTGRITIPASLVERALSSAPSTIELFDRQGKLVVRLGRDPSVFNPGSAALTVLDWNTQHQRKAETQDVIAVARLTESLEYLALQSTAVIPSDVPPGIADRYRLGVALIFGSKPVVTGTFREDGFDPMRQMLLALRGSEEELRRKPLAIFDCCPSPPLKWSHLTCQALLDCARAGIPAELVSMPLCGATAPVTLVGSLVQHTAETLSGIVIHQLASPGAPIIYGGSPAATDLRTGTTPMGAIETMMMDAAYNEIGRSFGLPTHAYMGLTDAKLLDAQAGAEAALGAVLAALSGVSVVSGPGMMDFESCFSLEKLVIDNEFCGMALRAARGIEKRDEELAADLYGDLTRGDLFLTSDVTLRWFREELFFPSPVIDRDGYERWAQKGRSSAAERAHARVQQLLNAPPNPAQPAQVEQILSVLREENRRAGGGVLPLERVVREMQG